MLDIPNLLDVSSFYGVKIGYKWNDNLFFGWDDVKNEKLNLLFLQLNHKASVGFAAAFAEWIYWRLYKKKDLSQLQKAIEPLWAGLIDKGYIVDWEYEEPREYGAILGVQRLVLSSLQETRRYYLKGRYNISAQLESQAMLARYVSPDQTVFDHWLIDKLKKAIQLFPIQYNRSTPADFADDGKPYYDSSHELPIPRDFFFDSDFDFEKVNLSNVLNHFLQKLSYEENEYLTSPEEMIKNGFVGVPYQFMRS